MKCVHSIHFFCKLSFKISFIHVHNIIVLFMVFKVNPSGGKTAGWQAFFQSLCSCFVFLISLTIISQFQSKGPLLFNVTGNNSFLLCPRYLAQVGCMKGSQFKIQCSKAFSIKRIIITFTHNQCMWCLHNHCCKA